MGGYMPTLSKSNEQLTVSYGVFTIKNLKPTRISQGRTARYMANALDYKSVSGYTNIEQGIVRLQVEDALTICEILGVPFHVLFFE